jgi:hypothetical protein
MFNDVDNINCKIAEEGSRKVVNPDTAEKLAKIPNSYQ